MKNNLLITFGDRLKWARNEAKLTQQVAAKRVGMSQGTLGELEREGQGSSYTSALADIYGVDSVWLATGKGDPKSKQQSIAHQIRVERLREVPVIGKGMGGLPDRIWSDGDFPVGASEEYAEVATQDQNAFLTEIEGSSMVPRYNPGEFALVEPNTDPELGEDVLVRTKDGETFLKRLLARRDGFVQLGSYNEPGIIVRRETDILWMYYVAHPMPRRKIKSRI